MAMDDKLREIADKIAFENNISLSRYLENCIIAEAKKRKIKIPELRRRRKARKILRGEN